MSVSNCKYLLSSCTSADGRQKCIPYESFPPYAFLQRRFDGPVPSRVRYDTVHRHGPRRDNVKRFRWRGVSFAQLHTRRPHAVATRHQRHRQSGPDTHAPTEQRYKKKKTPPHKNVYLSRTSEIKKAVARDPFLSFI